MAFGLRVAKPLVERLLRLAIGRPGRMSGRALILAYHNVVPEDRGLGDRSLHLPWRSFQGQLDLLETHCEVRELSSLLTEGPRGGRPNVAITFDDAYVGAVELALPELVRRRLPGTLFVAPGLLGAPGFWWDELAEGPGLPEALRQEALEAAAGQPEVIRRKFGTGSSNRSLPRHYRCADAEALVALASLQGLSFGAHSWSHANLARLPLPELEVELSRPAAWLKEAGLPVIPVLAYPYGRFSAEVETAAARAGYLAGLRVDGGWIPAGAERPWSLPRYNVPAGLSDDGFVLRLSGSLTT